MTAPARQDEEQVNERRQYRVTEEECAQVLALFATKPTITVNDVRLSLRILEGRARGLIELLGTIAYAKRVRGGSKLHFTVVPDAHAVIARRMAEQAQRRSSQGRKRELPAMPGPQYLWHGRSGAATHFDTDGMGRVVAYVGPERRSDPRWDLEDVA